MKKLLSILVLALISVSVIRADTFKLSNKAADELLGALLTLDSGLTAVNVTIAADNINELRPKIEAYSKGNAAALKRHHVVQGMKIDDPEYLAYLGEFESNQDAEIEVDLTRMSFTDEELVASKMKPGILSIIRKTLKPASGKK